MNLSSIPENCACPASPGRERLQGEVPPEPSSFAERKEDNGKSKEEKTAEEIAGVPVGVQALACPIPSPRYSGERARVRGLLLDPTLSTRDVELQPQRLKLKLFFAECTAIEGWNIAASHATGDFLKVWDDDLWATPGWLDAAEKSYQVIGSPELAYIGLWDKHAEVPEKLFTRAIGTRKFFVEICGGVLTIPAYQSWYDDTEKFDRAKAAGCAYYCPESIIEHRHPAYGFATDATYAIGEQRHTNDAETYRTRKEKGFPNDYPCVLSGSIPC